MKLYSRLDIEQKLLLSESQIKYIIKKMGILPAVVSRSNKFFYNEEQVQLIEENDFRNYTKNDGFNIYQSKLNYE